METIRILLVIQHTLVRAALRSLFEAQPDLEVVAEADNASAAIVRALELRPDVVVMDSSLEGMSALEATRVLLARWPNAVVLILAPQEDKYCFWEILFAGASGYITQNAEREEVLHAIYAAKEGRVYLQPIVAGWLLEGYWFLARQAATAPTQSAAHFESLQILEEPEREVLGLAAEGLTNREISNRLNISLHTVRVELESIMDKLHMKSRRALLSSPFQQAWRLDDQQEALPTTKQKACTVGEI